LLFLFSSYIYLFLLHILDLIFSSFFYLSS
jgi:hypothetical protein